MKSDSIHKYLTTEFLEEIKLSHSFKAWIMPDLDEDAIRKTITFFCEKYNFPFIDEKIFNDTRWELQRFRAHFKEYCNLKSDNKLKQSAEATLNVSENKLNTIDNKHLKNILSKRNSSKHRINKRLHRCLEIAEPHMREMLTMCISPEITEHMHWLECELASRGREFISISHKNFPSQEDTVASFINLLI